MTSSSELPILRPEPATAGHDRAETDVGSVFVSNYPPFSAWGGEAVADAVEAFQRPASPGADLGLYLHIPFCRKRCKFCYFRVYTDKNFDEIGSYLDALSREVELYSEMPAVAGRPLKFVYIGGGTPSYISVKHLEALAERLKAAIPWDGVEEVTFECEPGTLTRSKLEAIKGIGVTRLSLGIENFDDEILRINGRAHVGKEIERCLPWVEEMGFDQLNIDLIAGMVGERWETWRQTIARTVDLAPESVTIYQMELPYNSRFAKGVLDGSLEVELADWDLKRAWHDYAIDELSKAGYRISSGYTMAKDDSTRFVYRNSVWNGCDLVGAGVASFGHMNGVHVQNTDGWGEYLARMGQGELPLNRAYATVPEQRLIRELILQLKLGKLSGSGFQEKFGVDIFERFAAPFQTLEERGMLELGEGEVELTRQGLLRVDTLLPEFYEDAYRGARYT